MADDTQTGQTIDIATLPIRNLAATDQLFAIDPATMTGYRIPILVSSQSSPGFVTVSGAIPQDYSSSTLVPTFSALRGLIGSATGAVRYDTAQGLSTQQQQTARTNIGAEPMGALRSDVKAQIIADWQFQGLLQASNAPQNPVDVVRKLELDTKFDQSSGTALQATVSAFPATYLTQSDASNTYSTKNELSSVKSIADAAQTSQQVDYKITSHNQSLDAHANLLAGYSTTTDLSDVRTIAEAAQTFAQVQAEIGNHNSSPTAHANQFSLTATKSELQTGLSSKLDKTTADGLYVAQGKSRQDLLDSGKLSLDVGVPTLNEARSTLIPSLGSVRAAYDGAKSDSAFSLAVHNSATDAHENRFALTATAEDLASVKVTADAAVQPAQLTNAITTHNSSSDAHSSILDPLRTTLVGKMDTSSAQSSFIAKGGALSDLYDAGKYSASLAAVTALQKTSTVIPTVGALRATMEEFQSDYQNQLSAHNTSLEAHSNLVAGLASKDDLSSGLAAKIDTATANSTFATQAALQAVKTTAEYATTPEEVQTMIDESGSGDGVYDKVRLTLIPDHNSDTSAHSNQFGPISTALSAKLDKTSADAAYQPKGAYLTTDAAKDSYIPIVDIMGVGDYFSTFPYGIPQAYKVAEYISQDVIPSLTESLGVTMDNKVSAHNASSEAHKDLLESYVLNSDLTVKLAAKLDTSTAASTYATQTSLASGLSSKIDSTAAYAAFAGKTDLNSYVGWSSVFSSFGGERPSEDATSILPSLKYLDDGLSSMKSYVDQKIPSDPALTKDEAWAMMTGTAIPEHNSSANAHENILNPITEELATKVSLSTVQQGFVAKGASLGDLYDTGKFTGSVLVPGEGEVSSTVIPTVGALRKVYDQAGNDTRSLITAHNASTSAHADRFQLYQLVSNMTSYQTTAGMVDYLKKSDAQGLYQPLSGMSAYQTVAAMENYYSKSEADNEFQPKGDYLSMLATGSTTSYVSRTELINSSGQFIEGPRAFTAIPSMRAVYDLMSLVPSSVLTTDDGKHYDSGRVTNVWDQNSIDQSYIPTTRAVQAAIQSEVAGTYQTVAGMSSYLGKTEAQGLYQPLSGMSAYQTVSGMAAYLKSEDASAAYQPKGDYLLSSAADGKYIPLTRILNGAIGTGTTQIVTGDQVVAWGNTSVIPNANAAFLSKYVAPIGSIDFPTTSMIPWSHQVSSYFETLVPRMISEHNTAASSHENRFSLMATKVELTNGLSLKLDTSEAMDTYATQTALQQVKATADAAVQPSQMSTSITSAVNAHNTNEKSHGLNYLHAAFDNVLESTIPWITEELASSISVAETDAKIAAHNTAAESHANLIGPINTSLTAKLDKTVASSTYQTISGMSDYQKVTDMENYIPSTYFIGGGSDTVPESAWETTYLPCTNQLNNWINASLIPSIYKTISGTTLPSAIATHNTNPDAHNDLITKMASKDDLTNYILSADAASIYQPKGDYMLSSQASNFLSVGRTSEQFDMWREENKSLLPQAHNIMVWYDSSLVPAISSAAGSAVTTHNNSASAHATLLSAYAKQSDVTAGLATKLDTTAAATTYQPKGDYAPFLYWSNQGEAAKLVNPIPVTVLARDNDSTSIPVFSAIRDYITKTIIPQYTEANESNIPVAINAHNTDVNAHKTLFDSKISKAQADAVYQAKGTYLKLINADTDSVYGDARFSPKYPYAGAKSKETLIPSVAYVEDLITARNYTSVKDVESGEPYNALGVFKSWPYGGATDDSAVPSLAAVAGYVKPTRSFPAFEFLGIGQSTLIPPGQGGTLVPSADAIARLLMQIIGKPTESAVLPVYGTYGGWSYIPEVILESDEPVTIVPSINSMIGTVHSMCQYWGRGERVMDGSSGNISLDLMTEWYDLSSVTTGTTLVLDTSDATAWNVNNHFDRRVFTWKLWLPMQTLKTLVWPSNLKWLDGSAPTFEAGKAYVIALQYDLGGVLNGNVAYSRAL